MVLRHARPRRGQRVRTPPSSPLGARSVLVVDDDPPLRKIIRHVLERRGHTVVEARNGAEALDVVRDRREPIDLVLTDVQMPRMNGFDLVERLLRTHPDTRVLLMTGLQDRVEVRGGLKELGQAYLFKPFGPDELIARVDEVLSANARGAE